jgi:hypothetical protein
MGEGGQECWAMGTFGRTFPRSIVCQQPVANTLTSFSPLSSHIYAAQLSLLQHLRLIRVKIDPLKLSDTPKFRQGPSVSLSRPYNLKL